MPFAGRIAAGAVRHHTAAIAGTAQWHRSVSRQGKRRGNVSVNHVTPRRFERLRSALRPDPGLGPRLGDSRADFPCASSQFTIHWGSGHVLSIGDANWGRAVGKAPPHAQAMCPQSFESPIWSYLGRRSNCAVSYVVASAPGFTPNKIERRCKPTPMASTKQEACQLDRFRTGSCPKASILQKKPSTVRTQTLLLSNCVPHLSQTLVG